MDPTASRTATATMAYSTGLPGLLPILPAAIRRRIPRLYSSLHRAMGSGSTDRSDTATDGLVGPMRRADALRALAPSSTPDLGYCRPPSSAASDLGAEEPPRPATAGSLSSASSSSGKTLEALDLDEGRDTDAMDRESMLAKYEVDSGLRWNRVVPGMHLTLTSGSCHERLYVRMLTDNSIESSPQRGIRSSASRLRRPLRPLPVHQCAGIPARRPAG